MASYDIEHNVPPTNSNVSDHPPRRPDLSTFFATFEHVDTSNTNNENALPIPAEVSAAFRSLAEAFGHMRQDGSGDLNSPLEGMIEALLSGADMPPKEVKGVSQGFLDELERVPRKSLTPSMDCPICSQPFLDDAYPLVVRLPCNRTHMFDLECIAPWLKLHPTCPLDRKDLLKGKEPPQKDAEKKQKEKEEEEDGEWDDMYA